MDNLPENDTIPPVGMPPPYKRGRAATLSYRDTIPSQTLLRNSYFSHRGFKRRFEISYTLSPSHPL